MNSSYPSDVATTSLHFKSLFSNTFRVSADLLPPLHSHIQLHTNTTNQQKKKKKNEKKKSKATNLATHNSAFLLFSCDQTKQNKTKQNKTKQKTKTKKHT